MTSPKRIITATATLGGIAAVASVHLKLLTPEQIGVAAAVIAGGITVFTSWVAASKSISTDRKVDVVTMLVDGRYSDVLRELAHVRKILAERSGSTYDIERAKDAQVKADDQAARVVSAEKSEG